jgi:hypothetical protein
MSNEVRLELWRARVDDYRSSGLSAPKWCQKNEVTLHQLRYWVRRIRQIDQQPGGWARVEVRGDGPSGSVDGGSALTVRVGAASIDVRPGFDSSLLSEVLTVVARVC